MPGCATCPDPVKSVLRRRVNLDLQRVRAIKQMTTAVNRLVTELADKVTADLSLLIQLVGNIPEPVIDISELINWLTCPLLPIAILEDQRVGQAAFDALDPAVQIQKLKSMLAAYVEDLNNIYRTALRALNSYDIIALLQKYLDELKRIDLDAESFARSVAITATVAGLGQADAGCLTEFNEGPYAEFAQEITTFSFTGLYPTGFNANVATVMNHLAEAERKLSGWRVLIVTGL
jgi:hypothetical protein